MLECLLDTRAVAKGWAEHCKPKLEKDPRTGEGPRPAITRENCIGPGEKSFDGKRRAWITKNYPPAQYWSSPHLCDLAAKVLKFLEENDLWAKVEFFCLEYVDHGDSRLDLMIVVRNLAMLIDVLLDKKSIFPRCWWPEAFVLGTILMNQVDEP